jgi:signal peptidase II
VRVLYVTLAIVLLDQATKLLVKGFSLPWLDYYHAGMQLGESIPVIGEFFRITFVENPGMAFGIDFGWKLALTSFSLIASVGLFYYLLRIRHEPLGVRLSLACILGGAIGNLIDRLFYGLLFGEGPLFYGKVVDFFDMDFWDIDIWNLHLTRFPVFNIADASVTIGVILMFFFYREFSPSHPPVSVVESKTEEPSPSASVEQAP